MRGTMGRQVPWRLRRAAQRFDQWRRRRERGARIPRVLWTLAAELAATYGVGQTASALKLDYYGLQRRLAESTPAPAVLARGSAPSGGASQGAAFLQLPPALLAAAGECVIDFENARGAKMRVHLKGLAAPDLAALGRSFWGAP